VLGVVEMSPIEPEVQQRFDEIEDDLKDYDTRLRNLEIGFAKQTETLNFVKQGQEELKQSVKGMENTLINTNNSVLNSINQLLISKDNNSTQKKISKQENNAKVIIQTIIGLTALGTAIVAILK